MCNHKHPQRDLAKWRCQNGGALLGQVKQERKKKDHSSEKDDKNAQIQSLFSDPIWKCFLLLQQNLKMQTFFFVIPSCKRKKKKLFKQMRITKMLRSKAFFLIRSESVFFYYSKTWKCKIFFVILSFAIVKEKKKEKMTIRSSKWDDKNAQIQSFFSDPIWKCFFLLYPKSEVANDFFFVIQSFAIVKERQTKSKKDDKNAQI